MALNRRDLLGTLLLAALGSPFGRTPARATVEAKRLVDIYAELDARIGLRVANLGEAYLRCNPAEVPEWRLAELLGRLHGGSLHTALGQGPLAMQAALGEVYRRDFEAGRLVHVEGWVVSLTEARLHAWRYLTKT